VAPELREEIERAPVALLRRRFEDADVEGAFFVVAAALPAVNRRVAEACAARSVWLNAVDQPEVASVYTGGVVRRGGVTLAFSTEGRAPALAGLLREACDALLPEELETWLTEAEELRRRQKAAGVPMPARRPQLLEALLRLHSNAARAVS
jgi:uroporphyrin-III C-methyltransferase/precorrin-2 dehydrogenase/sirohydrochlorin ferrochelatase